MTKDLYLYPLWIRIWHGFNALFFILLLISGISMQYADNQTAVMSFDLAVATHNISGILISIFYLVFLVGFVVSDNKRHYKFSLDGLTGRLVKQMRYYSYGVFKGAASPFPISEDSKFNPLQQVTYVSVMFILFPVLILTGLSLFFPEIIIDDIYGVGGTLLTALLHATVGFLATIFLVIHFMNRG